MWIKPIACQSGVSEGSGFNMLTGPHKGGSVSIKRHWIPFPFSFFNHLHFHLPLNHSNPNTSIVRLTPTLNLSQYFLRIPANIFSDFHHLPSTITHHGSRERVERVRGWCYWTGWKGRRQQCQQCVRIQASTLTTEGADMCSNGSNDKTEDTLVDSGMLPWSYYHVKA